MSNQDNKNVILKSKSIYEAKHHILYVSEEIRQDNDLDEVLYALRQSGGDDILEMRINSPGGECPAGQKIVATVEELFGPERSISVMDPEAASMAVYLFLACGVRVVYPHSECMIHHYSMWVGGKGQEVGSRYESADKILKDYMKFWLSPHFSKKEIKQIINGSDFYVGSEEMCERGMATHVQVGPERITAKEYLQRIKDAN